MILIVAACFIGSFWWPMILGPYQGHSASLGKSSLVFGRPPSALGTLKWHQVLLIDQEACFTSETPRGDLDLDRRAARADSPISGGLVAFGLMIGRPPGLGRQRAKGRRPGWGAGSVWRSPALWLRQLALGG
jgi:hypothetical protein